MNLSLTPATRKGIVFLVAAALCCLVLVLALGSKPAGTVAAAKATTAGMPVSVRQIEPGAHPAVISALGEVVPLYQATIKSQVNGPVVILSERLQAGNLVKKGELLVQIERKRFALQLAEAKSRLATARVNLLKEEREVRQARRDWQNSGIAGAPPSSLVLRSPQQQAAAAEVDAAQAAVAQAETELGYTAIRAPFDGVVVERAVNPGESLFAGDKVAMLYGMQTAEVDIRLDAAQWALLPATGEAVEAVLSDPAGRASWAAKVVRDGQHLDSRSRLRSLFLQIERPLEHTPPLLPGTFVRVELSGRSLPDLLCIPETALTKQGLVWFVDGTNRLTSRQLNPAFYDRGVVFVPRPQDLAPPLKVAVSPNASFTNGIVVQPLAEQRG